MFYGFNQVELNVLFFINLPVFYSRYDKNSKKALKNILESAYYYDNCKLIVNITANTNI